MAARAADALTVPPARLPAEQLPGAGRGELTVAVAADGTSVVTRAYASSPLRLLMPRNHGPAAWVYTSSYGGGLVDGDRVVLDVDVRPGATAFLSTQASTKVYRSARGTSTELHARVGPGGVLVVAPDPVVCFAGSRCRQMQAVELDSRAGLVLVDWLSSGRHASGERWAFDEYHAQLRVRMRGRPIVHDSTALRALDGPLAPRMGRFDVLGTVLLLGAPVREGALAIVERLAGVTVLRRPDLLVTAVPVAESGCLLRFASTSMELAARMVREQLRFVVGRLGDDPWARKW
jgi:urease accessory protein